MVETKAIYKVGSGEALSGDMRRCCTCKLVKPVEHFSFKNRETGLRQPYCKPCKSAYNRRWYAKNTEKQKKDVRRSKRERRLAAEELIERLKGTGLCADCGGSFRPEAMDFDHVRGRKKRNISALVNQGASLELLRAELAQCELVCSNCHRVRTKQRGYATPTPSAASEPADAPREGTAEMEPGPPTLF